MEAILRSGVCRWKRGQPSACNGFVLASSRGAFILFACIHPAKANNPQNAIPDASQVKRTIDNDS
jgi:hypothetical protein